MTDHGGGNRGVEQAQQGGGNIQVGDKPRGTRGGGGQQAGGFVWLDDAGNWKIGKLGNQGISQFPSFPISSLLSIWLFLLFVLGWPGLGANAGSLAATGAGFGVGAAILRGQKANWRLAVGCILSGLLLALLFSGLEVVLSGPEGGATHLGGALQEAAGRRGPGYLLEIALRKIGMNLRLLTSPWLLLAAGGLVVVILLTNALIGPLLRERLAQRPWTSRGLPAIAAAAIASLLFKDSGVVTVTFLAGSAALLLLHDTVTVELSTESEQGFPNSNPVNPEQSCSSC